MNWQKMFISHIRSPFCRKSDSFYSHRVEDILSRREASRSFYMVVMAAKEKLRPEVKFLPPAVARNVRRVGDAEA